MKKNKAKMKILVTGFAKEVNGEELASSTTTLIQDAGLNIIVDPGMDRKSLLSALKKQNLSLKQIDYIVLTHTHLDHCLLAGIFENAKILDDSNVYTFYGKISEHAGKIPKTQIKIVKTPGHDQFHCSVLLDTEDLGKVLIAGDVFWWADDENQRTDRRSLLEHKDPYLKDKKALKENRKKILELADYIIPGHGNMFKVKK